MIINPRTLVFAITALGTCFSTKAQEINLIVESKFISGIYNRQASDFQVLPALNGGIGGNARIYKYGIHSTYAQLMLSSLNYSYELTFSDANQKYAQLTLASRGYGLSGGLKQYLELSRRFRLSAEAGVAYIKVKEVKSRKPEYFVTNDTFEYTFFNYSDLGSLTSAYVGLGLNFRGKKNSLELNFQFYVKEFGGSVVTAKVPDNNGGMFIARRLNPLATFASLSYHIALRKDRR